MKHDAQNPSGGARSPSALSEAAVEQPAHAAVRWPRQQRRSGSTSTTRARRYSIALVLSAAALVLSGASSPIIPTAPIINFHLPVFNEEGFRIWDVRGSEAIYSPAEQRAEIKGLHLKVYSGDDRELLQNQVESPLAIVLVNDRTVSGPGLIRMLGAERGREFEVRGEDWTYQETIASGSGENRKTKSVVIRKNVVVTFSEDIGSILQ